MIIKNFDQDDALHKIMLKSCPVNLACFRKLPRDKTAPTTEKHSACCELIKTFPPGAAQNGRRDFNEGSRENRRRTRSEDFISWILLACSKKKRRNHGQNCLKYRRPYFIAHFNPNLIYSPCGQPKLPRAHTYFMKMSSAISFPGPGLGRKKRSQRL